MATKNSMSPSMTRHLVFLDHSLTLRELIRKGGYTWINNQITDERFPRRRSDIEAGISVEDIILIHFGRRVVAEEVLDVFGRWELEALTPHPLVDFGGQCPSLQRSFPIAALGMSWSDPSDGEVAVYLCGSGTRDRRVHLHRGYVWGSLCRFAAREAA